MNNYNFPVHIHGHIASENTFRYNGHKVNIDTGCYKGGRLTSVVVNPNGTLFFDSIDSQQEKSEEGLLSFFVKRSNRIDFSKIDPKDLGRIEYFCRSGVPYISGTMSPAESDPEKMDIESLEKALEYFRSNDVSKVIMQPKYMGSRCTLVIHKELDKCFATSRNGFPIEPHRLDLTPVFKNMHKKFENKFNNGVKVLILDTELMPWSALGSDLIDRDFRVAGAAVNDELESLQKTGFMEQFESLEKRFEESGFADDYSEGAKKKLVEKYGQNDFNAFREMMRLKKEFISPDQEQEMIKVYNEQINLYGSEREVHVKPFMILKEVFDDDSEKTYFDGSNIEIFSEVSDDEYAVINLSKDDALEIAQKFYDTVTTERKMEGVVIKPEKVYTPGVAPYVKVRNKNYLHIIYGHNYTHESKLESLIKKKRVGKKRSISIKEFEIGMKMLVDIPFKDIGLENELYKVYIANMIAQERQEKSIDPRL